jgi:hypothetical protein
MALEWLGASLHLRAIAVFGSNAAILGKSGDD